MGERWRGRIAWVVLSVVIVLFSAFALSGCPYEANDDRDVTFVISLEVSRVRDDPRPRGLAPRTLHVGAPDAAALGLEGREIHDVHGMTFRLVTDKVDNNDLPFEHCFIDDAVIVDDETGAVVGTVPARTCVRHTEPLEVS